MSLTKNFDNGQWFTTQQGDGTIVTSEAGRVVTCKASTGLNRAYKKYYVVALPGETITFSCFARNRSADGFDGFARVWIDNKDGLEADFVEVRTDDTNLYTVSATIDITADGPQRVFFAVGVFGSIQGSADFFEPSWERSGSNVLMKGVFELPDGGGITLREDFNNYNIGTITWIDSIKSYQIQPKLPYDFSDTEVVPFDIQFKPVASLVGAPNGNTVECYSWTGTASNNVSWVNVQACTHALAPAVPVNLSTSTNEDRFFTLIVTMQD